LRADLIELERCSAAREPLEPETAAELYPLMSDVREALGRLVAEFAGDPRVSC
jgi:hypothetical protein